MSHICNDMTRLVLGGATILGASLAAGQVYEENIPLDHPAIQYRLEPSDDAVSRLAGISKVERGCWSSRKEARICRASSIGSA